MSLAPHCGTDPATRRQRPQPATTRTARISRRGDHPPGVKWLRRHFRSVAGRRPISPDVPSGRSENGWTWLGMALCLWSLAPRQAPRVLVSNANVRIPRRAVPLRRRPPPRQNPRAAAGDHGTEDHHPADSTQGRQAPVPLDRLPPAPAGSADDAPGTARRAVAAMVRELNDLLAPMISQLEALRQAGSTSDSLRRSREPARLRIVGDLHAWRSCPGLYRRTALSGLPGFCSGLPAVTV